MAADGTITFTGEITDTTCVIAGDGTVGSNFEVTLPTVSTTALSAAGRTAGAKAFDISLGTTGSPCAATNVGVNFEPGPNIDAATGMLRNATGGDYATNVQVAILNNASVKIDLRDNTNSQIVPVTGGIAVLNYTGQYEAVGGGATAGDVSTSVQYSITYP